MTFVAYNKNKGPIAITVCEFLKEAQEYWKRKNFTVHEVKVFDFNFSPIGFRPFFSKQFGQSEFDTPHAFMDFVAGGTDLMILN